MAQPATSLTPYDFTPPPADGLASELSPGVRHGGIEGPANRALSALSLALDGDVAPDDDKWAAGKSLRFIVVSCGLFWLTAAAAYFTLH